MSRHREIDYLVAEPMASGKTLAEDREMLFRCVRECAARELGIANPDYRIH